VIGPYHKIHVSSQSKVNYFLFFNLFPFSVFPITELHGIPSFFFPDVETRGDRQLHRLFSFSLGMETPFRPAVSNDEFFGAIHGTVRMAV